MGNFALLDNPEKFVDCFKDKDYDCVEVYMENDFTIYFAGAFVWKNNKIKPLDSDNYDGLTIIGYKELEGCLTVLANDW